MNVEESLVKSITNLVASEKSTNEIFRSIADILNMHTDTIKKLTEHISKLQAQIEILEGASRNRFN